MKQFKKIKRFLSGVLSVVMTISAVPVVSIYAEENTESYPYTMFAALRDEGAITINADNFSVNGNVATNGTIVSSGNININGTRSENANEPMIFIFDKIDNQYFSSSNIDEYEDDYALDEMNININVPTEVQGEATLTGNISINTALKALEDVKLYGEVKNTNDSVIFSKYGDIIIDSPNVNLNGLVYAPFGTVNITYSSSASTYWWLSSVPDDYDSSNYDSSYDLNPFGAALWSVWERPGYVHRIKGNSVLDVAGGLETYDITNS